MLVKEECQLPLYPQVAQPESPLPQSVVGRRGFPGVKLAAGQDYDTMVQAKKSWTGPVYRLVVLAWGVESCSCLDHVLAGMTDVEFADMAVAAFVDNADVVLADMAAVVLAAMLDPLRTAPEHSSAAGHEGLAHHKAWGASP